MNEEENNFHTFIIKNLPILIDCTVIPTELAVMLLSSGLINGEQMEELGNKNVTHTVRVKYLYYDVARMWTVMQFEQFKRILFDTRNNRALELLETQVTKTATQKLEPMEVCETSKMNAVPTIPGRNNHIGNVYKNGKRFCLIINVPTNRPGAHQDEIALHETFHGCKFDIVEICKDWTKEGMRQKLRQFVNEIKLTAKDEDIGAVVIVVASHGVDYDRFLSSDELELDLYSDVIDLLNGRNAPELSPVPKVFLVNICRGDKVDSPAVQTDSASSSAKYNQTWMNRLNEKVRQLSTIQTDSAKNSNLPCWANMLVGFASYNDHVAYRDIQEGSWYFQEICRVIRVSTKDNPTCVKSILEQVSEVISTKQTERGEKQMPTWTNIGFSKSLLLQYHS